MKVVLAESMGMCFGVRDALAVMRGVEKPVEVTVFGELVHNPAVGKELRGRGFGVLEEVGRGVQAVGTGRVLITAHGVSEREREELTQMGKEIVDTTCPLVRKAHAAAMGLAKGGYFVVVVGRRGHVEVRGLTGDLEAGRFDVVERAEEVRMYGEKKIGVMAQTTCVEQEARGVVERVCERNPGSEVKWVDTICMPTKDRQAAMGRLLEAVDVVVVVGGRGSNNTRQLARRAEEKGVRAMHVEGAGELREDFFRPWEVVGLTAGTSTLAETVEAVREELAGFFAPAVAKGFAA